MLLLLLVPVGGNDAVAVGGDDSIAFDGVDVSVATDGVDVALLMLLPLLRSLTLSLSVLPLFLSVLFLRGLCP